MSIKKGNLNIDTSEDYKLYVHHTTTDIIANKINLTNSTSNITFNSTHNMTNGSYAVVSLNAGSIADGYYLVTKKSTNTDNKTVDIVKGYDYAEISTSEIPLANVTGKTNSKLFNFDQGFSRILRSFTVPGFEADEVDITTTTDKNKVNAIVGSTYQDLSLTMLSTSDDPLGKRLRKAAHSKEQMAYLITKGKTLYAYVGTVKNKASLNIENGNAPVEIEVSNSVEFGFEGEKE